MTDLQKINAAQLKTELPDFGPGDTVKVHTWIKEGDKQRIQIFEGIVLRRSNGNNLTGNFTVRRIASGVGVEKTFMIHSPNVDKIEVLRKGKVKRAKLYYLRNLKTKKINIKQQWVQDTAQGKAKKKAAEA